MELAFNIKELDCRYRPDKCVIKVKALEIPKRALVFFLGLSGIGKSTLLETLGLMNQTIYEQSIPTEVTFYANDGAKPIHELTKAKDDTLSEIRKRYFSFIFQQANLMPHFSAGDNMCVPMMLEKEISYEKAKEKVLSIMEEVDLKPEVFEKPIAQLSGGQRQRLTFVRAFTSSFEVLFGDEPTGNLDVVVARKLMETLRVAIQENKKTGIIVSHDIDLALAFGDQIVVITPEFLDEENYYGVVRKNNILRRIDNCQFTNNQQIFTNSEAKQFIEHHFSISKPTVYSDNI